jgi:hypothetical protein
MTNNIFKNATDAFSMGYSVEIDFGKKIGKCQLISCSKIQLLFLCHCCWETHCFTEAEMTKKRKAKIIGYKYGADLCGSGEIPVGQVFKKRDSKVMVIWHKDNEDHGDTPDQITLENEDGGLDTFDKSELEPVMT